jgi:asparagine synthase (glutamine-hydrolysing)
MLGICGFSSPTAHTAPDITVMLEQMRRGIPSRVESHTFMNGAIGCAAISDTPRMFCLETAQAGKCAAVLVGSIHDAPEQRRLLEDRGDRFTGGSHAELLLRGILAEGQQFLRRLNGRFSGAIWLERAGRLLVVNDRFGLTPLYYTQKLGGLAFASSIKPLLGRTGMSPRLGEAGVAQFFAFLYLLDDQTLFADIRALPPACLLTYTVATGALRIDRYWDALELFAASSRSGPGSDTGERIAAAFGASVERCVRDAPGLGLSLSGGLDSRTLLAAIPRATPLTCVTLGMQGSIDRTIAARLARFADRPIYHSVLDNGFLRGFEDHLRRMVRLTDGHYASSCIVIPSLDLYRALGIRVLLRGHGGELMHMNKAYAFSADRSIMARSGDTLGDWLFRRLSGSAPGGSILTKRYRRSAETLARSAFDACFGQSADIEASLHRICHFFVAHGIRRAMGLSMAKFDSVAETRLPYFDAELIAALMAAAPAMKIGDGLHAMLLQRYAPEFLKVPNANTGAPIGASWLRRTSIHGMNRVLAKLGVDGYQPYERIGLWLRGPLLPMVRRILLGETCLDRGVLDPGAVRRTLDEHAEGRTNHTHMILAMLAFETGQQELFQPGAAGVEQPGPLNPQ